MTLKILGGEYKGRLLKSPKGQKTRPTQGIVRQAVFNICQAEIEGATFLDLFAGSGGMGLEALSRGAAFATFVEKDRHALACIKENIHILKVSSKAKILPMDVASAVEKLQEPFHMIYIDPPYGFSVENIVDKILAKGLLSSLLFIEEREKTHESMIHPSLELYDKRRYGIALLSIFRKKNQ
ncbi:MAG: 16S rRNA (guanine(966)-N(2))-methyltransferase RsmD [Chlamydiales bacterium]|nr:16S rRNA (guanine(966)-N(2))-methyltransferase RsmD [Chlamydiales bacterium]